IVPTFLSVGLILYKLTDDQRKSFEVFCVNGGKAGRVTPGVWQGAHSVARRGGGQRTARALYPRISNSTCNVSSRREGGAPRRPDIMGLAALAPPENSHCDVPMPTLTTEAELLGFGVPKSPKVAPARACANMERFS